MWNAGLSLNVGIILVLLSQYVDCVVRRTSGDNYSPGRQVDWMHGGGQLRHRRDTHSDTDAGSGECSGGVTWNLSDPEGIIVSPQFGTSNYGSNSLCFWTVQVPTGQVVEYTMEWLFLSDGASCSDVIYIYYDRNFDIPLVRMCGHINRMAPRVSTGNVLGLSFTSDGQDEDIGFKLRYSTISGDIDTGGDNIGPCGGTGASYIDLSDGPVKLISPGYTTIPEPITANLEHCRYQVEAPEGMFISGTVEYMDLEDDESCLKDYLEVRLGSLDYNTDNYPYTFCGPHDDDESMEPEIFQENRLLLTLRTDGSHQSGGFAVYLEAVNASSSSIDACQGRVTLVDEGTISNPNYPEMYDASSFCEWELVVAEGSVVQLEIADLDIEFHPDCDYDSVEFIDTITGISLGKLCGDNPYPTPTYMSSSNNMVVRFVSDGSTQLRGFTANFHGLDNSDAVCSSEGLTLEFNGGIIAPSGFPGNFQSTCDTYTWTIAPQNMWFEVTLGHVGIPDCDVGSLVISLAGDEVNYCDLTPDDPMFIGHALGEVVVTYTTISRRERPRTGFSVGFVSAFDSSQHRACNGEALRVTAPEQVGTVEFSISQYTGVPCELYINPLENMYTELTLNAMLMGSTNCDTNSVAVYDVTNDGEFPIRHLCQSFASAISMTSSSTSGLKVVVNTDVFIIVLMTVQSVEDPGENETPPYCPDEGDVTAVEVSAGDVISSFGFPEDYHDNICQEWQITLDPGQKPYILFDEFAIEAVTNGCPDVVEIFSINSDSSTTSLGSYCGLHETLKVKSLTNSLLIRFTTNNGYVYRGFQGTFGIDNPTLGPDCPAESLSDTGSLTLPLSDATSLYEPNIDCRYTLEVSSDMIIKVTLSDVDLEYSIGCVHDAITFYDGSAIVDDVIATVCGNHDNVVKYSRSSTMLVTFTSDGQLEGSGFSLQFQQQDPNNIPWSECGTPSIAPRIVGGSPAIPNSHPWLVGLYSPSLGIRPWCGGTIVDRRTIITAAHCLADTEVDVNDLSVMVGTYEFLDTVDHANMQFIPASEYTNHPQYINAENGNDIAVIKLAEDIVYSQRASPICMPSSEPTAGATCVSTGWGTTASGGHQAHRVMSVEMTLHSDEDCANNIQPYDETMICAGNLEEGGVDTCQGDSGGPFICQNEETNHWELVGVVSWGRGCGDPGSPGLYAEVFHQLEWLQTFLGETQTPPFCPDEGEVTAVEVSAGDVISSFRFPEDYHDNICQDWQITLDSEQKPYILFDEFAIEAVTDGCADVVDIFAINPGGSTTSLGSYCGLHETLKVKSPTNSLLIRFTTDNGITYKGFHATFGIDNKTPGPDCPAESFSDTGSLTLPVADATSLYEPNIDCRYTLEVPNDMIIKVTLSDVDLEYSIGCVHDAITFYDGSEIVDDVIATVCGNHDNVVKYSRSSTMLVTFTSDGQLEGSGFSLEFQQQDPNNIPWSECGTPSIAPRIVGGAPAIPNSHPWLVGLYNPSLGINPWCGGSIVDRRTIITAAHCLEDEDVDDLSVMVGTYEFLDTVDHANMQFIPASEYTNHPQYISAEDGNDIAVIKLAEDIVYSQRASPICMPTSEPTAGATCVSTGWGTTESEGHGSHRVMSVEMTLHSDEDCANNIQPYDETMICAGNLEEGGVDTCQGDSGGPFICQNEETNHWELVGVVSWGRGCGDPGSPGLYAEVFHQLEWLQTFLED